MTDELHLCRWETPAHTPAKRTKVLLITLHILTLPLEGSGLYINLVCLVNTAALVRTLHQTDT